MKMATKINLLFITAIIVTFDGVRLSTATTASGSHVNFVVVGATGSLAQKYLWQGMYDLREEINGRHDVPDLVLYGAARAEPSKGEKALLDILNNKVSYGDNENMKEEFIPSVRFVQLKTCEHYEEFCSDILNVPRSRRQIAEQKYCQVNGDCDLSSAAPSLFADDDEQSLEAGRIFYLAVPPYSYAEVAKCVHRVCRPSNPDAFLRLVLEKPFGTNVDTVNSLVKSLREDFQDDEIYLVDHYLGKPAVQQILEFRHLNREWLEHLLDDHHVEKVEIAIKEKEDLEGRLNYFDTYGVFLDVLQNHAVEMLCLLAMNLPVKNRFNNTDAIRREKLSFLRSVLPIHPDHVVAGQYSDYVEHGKREFGREDFQSDTATFGALVLQVPNSRWRGVPFFLVSGKALDAKVSLVRITFKNPTFPIGENVGHKSSTATKASSEITISISSPTSARPTLSVTKTLSDGHPVISMWTSKSNEASSEDYHQFQYDGRDRAYSTVVSDVFFGRRENFVSMEQLTVSWAIWDQYLKRTDVRPPKLYRRGFPEDLEVAWTGSGLRFVTSEDEIDDADTDQITPKFKLCNADGINVSTVVKPISKLIKEIVRDLKEAIESNDSDIDFHIAIPGGNTPVPIFHELLTSSVTRHFPWNKLHFWFTDERCVPLSHIHSNYLNAEETLLKYLQLSNRNVHPMPVELQSGLCSDNDKGTVLYNDELQRYLGDKKSLDVVILGVGSDGHVASLFPKTETEVAGDNDCLVEGNGDEWVTLTKATGNHIVDRRMSLTFKTISNARNVFVVITGKGKHGVVRELLGESSTGSISSSRFPVKNVAAAESLRIYIDNDAYYG